MSGTRRRLALVVPPSPTVIEIKEVDRDIGNPGNVWHDVTGHPEVEVGWQLNDAGQFTAPSVPRPEPQFPAPPTPNLLAQQIEDLTHRVEALEEEQAATRRRDSHGR